MSFFAYPAWFKWLIGVTSIIGYMMLFLLLEGVLGFSVVALSIIPAAIFGWVFGMWAGIVSGFLTFVLNVLLLTFVGYDGVNLMFLGGITGTVSAVVVGGLVGRLYDLSVKLNYELSGARGQGEVEHDHSVEVEERTQSMLETIGEGIVLTDEKGIITYVNPAFVKMLGYSGGELVGTDPADFFTVYDLKEKPLAPEFLSNSAAVTARKQEVRVLLQAKDDGKVAVVMNSAPVYVGGEFRGVVRVVHDYSEDLLLQTQKDDFFSIASHELRTPLTVISGNLDILREGYGKSKVNIEAREVLNDTLTASDRLIKMINDFLNVSRLDQGRLKPELEPFDLCSLTSEVIKEMKLLAKEKKLKLIFSCARDHGKVMADGGLVKEVLINLIGNSLKFTRKGGVRVEHGVDGENLVTRVSDTGIGIDKDKQNLLFQRFQQVMKRTLSREAGGTGLGLYISREFVRMMGGDLVLVKSESGKGSVFEFGLPLVSGGKVGISGKGGGEGKVRTSQVKKVGKKVCKLN